MWRCFWESAHAKPKRKRTRRPDAEFEPGPRTEIAKESLGKTKENGRFRKAVKRQFPSEFIRPAMDPEYHHCELSHPRINSSKAIGFFINLNPLVSTSQGPYPPILRPEQRQSLLVLCYPISGDELLENEFIPSAEAPRQSIFKNCKWDAQYLDHYLRSVSQQQIPFQSYDIDVDVRKDDQIIAF